MTELIFGITVNRCHFKLVKENNTMLLLEYDFKWQSEQTLSVGKDSIVNWLMQNIKWAVDDIETSNNNERTSILKELVNAYNQLLENVHLHAA